MVLARPHRRASPSCWRSTCSWSAARDDLRSAACRQRRLGRDLAGVLRRPAGLRRRRRAGAFLAGYLVEKSLSLDNVFVFLLVFTAFGVADRRAPPAADLRHRAALVMRAVFIVVGAAALQRSAGSASSSRRCWSDTGWRMFRHRHDHDGEDGELVDAGRARGSRRSAGARGARAIAVVDVIFAVDSVPAILAITDDTFIVFAANAFALLGLRPLFFLVADLVERLYYLKTALAALLVFIGSRWRRRDRRQDRPGDQPADHRARSSAPASSRRWCASGGSALATHCAIRAVRQRVAPLLRA